MKVSDYIASVIGSFNPFVVQGGAAVHMIDSLARGGHKYICCAHEQAAGFAADGFARVKGLGVVVTTCGPGATNLLTSSASAYFENVPVLYLVGQQHGFQELDVVGMFDSVTRYAKQVFHPDSIVHDLELALLRVKTGPVLLNIFDEVYHSDINAPLPPVFLPTHYQAPKTELIFSKKRTMTGLEGYSYRFMEKLNKYGRKIVTDIGNHGVWVLQSGPAISDNSFGAMGYAIAASMGVACAGEKVSCVTGDGSIQMNIQELATIAKHDMDIKIFVLNNSGYGMIKNTQDVWLEGRHSGCDLRDLPLVDFERVATAYGIPNRRWESEEDMDFSVLNMKGPVLINVMIDGPIL